MNRREQTEAFESAARDHAGIVWKIARSFTQTPTDADDLSQEIWLSLWRALPKKRGDAKLSTFIYRVAFNRAVTWSRTKKRRQGAETSLFDEHTTNAKPERSQGEIERIDQLYRAIRELKEIDRAILLLSLEERSYEEISETLGISVNAVGARLSRAKGRLQTKLLSIASHE